VIRVAKGQDGVVEIVVYTAYDFTDDGKPEYVSVKASAPALAAAVAVSIERLKYALATGDMIEFPGNLVATVNGAHAIGATTLVVTALPGPIAQGEVGRKLQNLDSYELELEMLVAESDAAPTISKDGTNETQSTIAGRGRSRFAFLAADTSALTSKRYAANAWRRNAGTSRPVWQGNIEIYDAGFQ